MSENDTKRKAEESVIEKIYKKIKKLEDHYYSLKKSGPAVTTPHVVAGSSKNKGDPQGKKSNLIDQIFEIGRSFFMLGSEITHLR